MSELESKKIETGKSEDNINQDSNIDQVEEQKNLRESRYELASKMFDAASR